MTIVYIVYNEYRYTISLWHKLMKSQNTSQPLLGRAIPRTLRTEVVEILRDAIVTGQLKPGQRLKEGELAEQMHVSRSPVREAFRQLEQEGLIVSVPNQGSYVKSFDAREIEEIFTLRAALENLACELIIENNLFQPSDWKQLELLIERQREAIAARDVDRLGKLDMDFHEYICQCSGSRRLVQMWRSLRAQILVLFYQRFKALKQVPETVDTDHMAIMKALKEGNVEKITRLNKEINARVARECIEVFSASPDEYYT
ncbi:MAG: GntR family transcriptional regulator [Caldilineae bacterium]|nr:MAG: GntR family transcriptional regulator [Caldilineae bacterium]